MLGTEEGDIMERIEKKKWVSLGENLILQYP